MTDEWILSTDKEKCPECEAAIARYRDFLDRPVNWLEICVLDCVLDCVTDFDGEEPGAGGIVEVEKREDGSN